MQKIKFTLEIIGLSRDDNEKCLNNIVSQLNEVFQTSVKNKIEIINMKRKILNELYLYPKSLNATTYKKVSISFIKLIDKKN